MIKKPNHFLNEPFNQSDSISDCGSRDELIGVFKIRKCHLLLLDETPRFVAAAPIIADIKLKIKSPDNRSA